MYKVGDRVTVLHFDDIDAKLVKGAEVPTKKSRDTWMSATSAMALEGVPLVVVEVNDDGLRWFTKDDDPATTAKRHRQFKKGKLLALQREDGERLYSRQHTTVYMSSKFVKPMGEANE